MEVLTSENKILRHKAKRVFKIDDQIRTVCVSMVNTMIKMNGVGLSGNQVGILKRIIVILHDNKPLVLINPEITNYSEETILSEEGCLSIPETFIDKKRYKTITVKYRDTKGVPHLEKYHDLSARIIQHEIDHLDGILMTDE